MKCWFCILLSLLLCLSLFGCGQKLPAEHVPDSSADDLSELPPLVEAPSTLPSAPQETPLPTPPAEQPDDAPSQEPVDAPALPETSLTHDIVITQNANGDTVFQLDIKLPDCETLPKIHSYYQQMTEDLKSTYALLHADATHQQAESQAMGLDFTPWQVQINTEILRNDGTTLSILREIYENFGGAHPTVTYRAENFDIATQGRLLLGNLFTVSEEEYLIRLQDMVLAQMDKRETEDGIRYFESAREQPLSLLDPMDFALTEDSLLLIFNVYALAPYAAGPQYFYLPLSNLTDIVKPQYLTE